MTKILFKGQYHSSSLFYQEIQICHQDQLLRAANGSILKIVKTFPRQNASQQLFWLYKQAFKAFKVGTEYTVARRVQMNCLYSSSASQKARGKGLWPVPGLCTRDSVSCLSPKVNINPAQEVSLTGTHTQATLHIVFYLPLSVTTTTKNFQQLRIVDLLDGISTQSQFGKR